MAPEISLGGNFVLDSIGQFYSTTTIYGYIKRTECQISNETLLSILNSQLCWWYLVNTGTVLANGYYRYKPGYLKTFPIPIISNNMDSLIQEKVIKRINDPSSIQAIEKEINQIIYEIYGLSIEEIGVVENV